MTHLNLIGIQHNFARASIVTISHHFEAWVRSPKVIKLGMQLISNSLFLRGTSVCLKRSLKQQSELHQAEAASLSLSNREAHYSASRSGVLWEV